MSWLSLIFAIVLEVAGTTCMKLSEGFTRWHYGMFMFLFYGLSVTCLTIALKKLDVSMAYAIWSGLGTALIAVLGFFLFREQITTLRIFALALIITGVILLNFTSANH